MKRNWSVFQMVLLVISFSLATYILHQLLRYSNWGWLGFILTFFWVTAIFILALSQPFYFWGNENINESVWFERLNIVGYLAFPYVSDMLTLVLLRDIIGFAAWGGYAASLWAWDGYSLYSGEATLVILSLPFLMTFLGYLTIELGPFVRKIKIRDKRIPESFHGLQIAHLTDIHFGPMMRDRLVKKLIAKVQSLHFDLMVLTGDIVDCDPERFSENLWGLKELKAKLGVFYCSGNHEYYWNFSKIRPHLQAANWKILHNNFEHLERAGKRVTLVGVPDPVAKYFPTESAPDWSVVKEINTDYKILLSHQPHLASEAVQSNVNLQLSGHTHAGQFFPWNFLIYLFQKYSHGLYRVKKNICKSDQDDLWLYVNQGTGFWGPPTRLGTYCEITLIELLRN